LNFINKTKPAVTKVLLLWTKELIGVGVLIAFGNQIIKGNVVLFVIIIIKIIIKIKKNIIIKFILKKIKIQNNKIKKSPKRLTKIVFFELK